MILIIDNKSKHVPKIKAHCKKRGVKTTVLSDYDKLHRVLHMSIKGVILSGGPVMFVEKVCMRKIALNFAAMMNFNVPIMGICLGHQAIIEAHGGRVKRMNKKVYGLEDITLHNHGRLLKGLPKQFKMHEAHQLTASKLPPHFELLATSKNCKTEAIQHKKKHIYGVQFHPENSGELGKLILDNFLKICKVYRANK